MNKINKYFLMAIGVYQIIGGLFGFTGFTKLKMDDFANNYLLVLIIFGYCVFLRFRTPNPDLTGHSVLT